MMAEKVPQAVPDPEEVVPEEVELVRTEDLKLDIAI